MDHTSSTRLHEFFRSMARQSFAEVGVGDESVVGYVAALMTEFARADRLYALRNQRGRVVDGVVEMLVASAPKPTDRRSLFRTRALRKYVGDYTLFMSGLFRTHVEQCGVLDYYLQQGSRSYWAVSELGLDALPHGIPLLPATVQELRALLRRSRLHAEGLFRARREREPIRSVPETGRRLDHQRILR